MSNPPSHDQRSTRRESLRAVIFDPDAPAGRRFDVALLITILLSVGVVMADGSVASAGAVEVRGYALEVRLDPGRQHVGVDGRVSLHPGQGESAFSFGLHETFRISRCTIDGQSARCRRPGGNGGREVSVELPQGTRPGVVDLELAYEGAIENRPGWGDPRGEGPFMDDSAGPDRVELAIYSNWYPVFGFGHVFDAELELGMPPGWGVTCIGQRIGGGEEGGATTRWEARAVNDLVIVASPGLRSKDVATAAGTVRIHHTRLPDRFLDRMAQETEQTLLLFSKLLGGASGDGVLQHVYSPRDWGQGFARPGLIVSSEGRVLRALAEDPEASFLYGDAHEAGHFWWRFGAGQGDWINETFAEYFALVALQSIQGEDSYQEALARRRDTVAGLPEDAPPLAAVLMSDQNAYTVRYEKGALMLHALRERLGDEAFFRASRRFYESIRDSPGAGTDEFRGFWKDALGDEALLSAWLDSSGSGPAASSD
jgi:hypothetical protein